jgi:hypothetical protein
MADGKKEKKADGCLKELLIYRVDKIFFFQLAMPVLATCCDESATS